MDSDLFTYLQRLDRRLQLLLLVMPFIVVTLAGYRFLLDPLFREYRDKRASRIVLEEAVENGEEISSELTEIRKLVEGLQTRVYGKNMNLPMKQLEARIIGRLQEISSRNHVQLIGVRPGPKKRLRMFVESPVDVEVNGDYFDLARWLWELSAELGFIVVKDYEMQPATTMEDPLLRMKLTMVSYRTARS